MSHQHDSLRERACVVFPNIFQRSRRVKFRHDVGADMYTAFPASIPLTVMPPSPACCSTPEWTDMRINRILIRGPRGIHA